MKRHRKLVALLVALTFLFSIVAPVMAATPSEAEKAADKLNVLGIIEGYPDGSFGLDRNITRAEFAKIAVVAAGLKDAAEQLVNFPSQFSDVATGEWYTGWINMAASQGFVKGDPAGTFRPNDNITYAEVVTVLVRLLGYNDNLTGPWPTNYLAKAVELGITKGVSLNASAPAVRGDVFVMTNNTLDCELVQWSTDKLDWFETGKKLIVKSFKGEMYEGLVTGVSWDSKGDLYVDILGYGKNAPSGSMKVIKNVVVTGAADPFGLLGKEVEFIRNEKDKGADRNAIVYLGAKETDVVSDDEATLTDDYIEIDGKKYDLASGFDVTFFPVDGEWDDEGVEKADKIEVVLNEDGEAQWAFVYNYPDPDVIKEIDGDRAFGYNHVRIELDEDEVQVFVKDGAIASFDALAEGDLVYVYEDVLNADLLVIAVSEVHEGTLETAHKNWNNLTIDGTRISTAYNGEYIVSTDGGDTFGDSLNNDMFGEAIKYMLSPAGRIAVVISGSASSNLVGVVEYVGTTARGVEVRIVNPDSTKAVYYVDSDYYRDNYLSLWKDLENDVNNKKDYVLVEYSLDGSGRIDYVRTADEVLFVDYDGNRAKISTDVNDASKAKWFRVNSDAGFFGFDTKGKLVGTNWSTFRTASSADPKVQVIWPKNAVKAMYIPSQIVDNDKVGVIAASGRNSGGYYYDVFIGGERVRYNLTNAAADKELTVAGKAVKGWNLSNGTVIEFDLSSGKISDLALAAPITDGAGTVTERGSDYIRLDNGQYWYFDEDTMIVDVTKDTKRIVGNVAKGDYVSIYGDEEDGVVELVVITKEPATTPQDPGLGDGGTVTYIDLTNKAIYIDGKAYVYSDNVVLKTAKGSIIATGADAVLGDGTNAGALDEDDRVEVGKIVDDRVTELIGLEVASVQAVADPINTEIEALPSVDEATLTDKSAVDTAKGNYDALAPYVKDFVKAENVAKLNALVAKMEQLQAAADAADVAADKAALTITGDLSNVTSDLTLPATGENGSTITWASNNAAINATTGAVTRPSYLEGDATVTLTATITKGDAKDTKVFTVVVKATTVLEDINGAADAQAMRALLEGLVKKGDFDAASSEKWNSLLGGQKDTVATNIYNAKESSPFTDFDEVKTLFATELGL